MKVRITTAITLLLLVGCATSDECECVDSEETGPINTQSLERDPGDSADRDDRIEERREREAREEAQRRERERQRQIRQREFQQCMQDPQCRRPVVRGRISEVVNIMGAQDVLELNRLLEGVDPEGQVNSLGIGLRSVACPESVFSAWLRRGAREALNCSVLPSAAVKNIFDYAFRYEEKEFLSNLVEQKINQFSPEILKEIVRYELLTVPESDRIQIKEYFDSLASGLDASNVNTPNQIGKMAATKKLLIILISVAVRDYFDDDEEERIERLEEENEERQDEIARERRARQIESERQERRIRELEERNLQHEADKAANEMDPDLADFILNGRYNDA